MGFLQVGRWGLIQKQDWLIKNPPDVAGFYQAERERFELSVRFRGHTLSRRAS